MLYCSSPIELGNLLYTDDTVLCAAYCNNDAQYQRLSVWKDRLQRSLDKIESFDVRDRWLGIRHMKKQYTPEPYKLIKEGRTIPPPRFEIQNR